MSTGVTAHGSEFAKFEYSSDNQVWNEIPGISGYTESGGEAPERDVVAFSGVAKRSGHPRVPSIELQAVYQPAHAAWKAMREASVGGKVLQFRMTTQEESLFAIDKAAHTVALATTGVVTLAGAVKPDFTEAQYGVGQVIKVGGDNYVIDSISDDATPEVKVKPAPKTAVAAATDYEIVLPSLRRGPFGATVRIADNVSLESEGDMTTTLTLAPRGRLPEWKIV